MESPAPTPPPRKSSSQRSANGGNKSGANSIDETLSRGGHSAAPSSSAHNPSPLANRTRQRVDRIGDSLRKPNTEQVHASLQHSIGTAPSRPSREGTTDLGESRPAMRNEHKAGFSSHHRQFLDSAFEEPSKRRIPVSTSHRNPSESSLSDSNKPKRSPSKLGKLSRLGLFSRRGNAPADVERSPGKLQKRGPVAGTGHEGYGKYGRRTRKTSTETSGAPSDSEQSVSSAGRTPLIGTGRKGSISSSRRNRSSQSDLDDFTATRLKPVVMRGGSQSSIPLPTDLNYTGTRMRTPERPASRTSSVSPAVGILRDDRPRLRSPRGQISKSRELLSDQSESQPSLALRRSQKSAPGSDAFPMPLPIFTDDLVAPTQITSYDTSYSSLVPTSTAPSSSGADMYHIDPTLLRATDRKTKRTWWNPFKRRHPAVSSPEPVMPQAQWQPEMAVSIATGPAPRSFPYYAMMESESDNNTTDHNIGDYLSQAVESPPHTPDFQAQMRENQKPVRKTDSVLLPSAPVWSEETYRSSFEREAVSDRSIEQLVKQPRLPQVGRIPKVVSRSERQHVPNRRSFSRPFVRGPDSLTPPPESPRKLDPAVERPHLEIHTDVLPSRPFPEAVNISAKPASAPAASKHRQFPPVERYVFDALSRHASEVSGSSSSDGVISVMGPPLIPTQRERELDDRMPAVRIPSMHPGDDEIWNEYDDFIDHVMSPTGSKKLKGQEVATRHQNKQVPLPGFVRPQRSDPRDELPIHEPRRAMLDLPLPGTLRDTVRVPSPLSLSGKQAMEDIRLRRSRIVSALHSSIDPSSPFSMREFLMDYDAQGRDSFAIVDRHSASTAGQMPPISQTSTGPYEDASRADHSQRENALRLDTVARSKNPARESELHYASLEVARWLSFGRVLFSPAHEEVHFLQQSNVLVVDGLGNEDWSIYCAVNYEDENAVLYDLKESSNYKPPGTSQHPATNLRRAQVSSLSDRFPFPSAFFSAIVLRFLPAMSEAKMRNVVTECRRTLVPGGHLELMMLDLDIVNMGVQTRRAVRELKMTMATNDPEISLKPGIDNFQNILGGRGFVGLNRCVVGVPVVGRPSGSMDSSSSSRSSRESGNLRRGSGDPAPAKPRNHNFSLNELVADHSEKADAKIGRLVSTCARSWWVHCFEATVIPDGDLSRSIFADKRVLQECKSRASSFKLLIAYAQRPVFETRRRTMSEPGGGTLATAGPHRRNKAPVE